MLIIATLLCVSAGAQNKKVYFDKATDTYKEVTLKSEKISEEDTIPYLLQIFADKTKPLEPRALGLISLMKTIQQPQILPSAQRQRIRRYFYCHRYCLLSEKYLY